ncbi:MAG TPA: SHOCT domain-containing protein [Roseiflexaceae bacterium]|nr:SHOCT domain-containing protein [Roseiflexaceae bacterium]
MGNKQSDDNARTGGIAGMGAGAVTGATLGTALIPIPVVGTFAGALVGGVVGSEIGKTVGGAILDIINPPGPTPPAAAQQPGEDVLGQLERLSHLRAAGVLTEEEFRAAKAKLLGL